MENKNFVKMHGTGNDFIIIQPQFFGLNNKRSSINTFTQEQKSRIVPQVMQLCRQKFSIGANGVLIVSQVENKLYKMTVVNSNGSIGANCGNGLRCIAVYLHKKKSTGMNFLIGTDSGNKNAEITINQNKEYFVKINLGLPSIITEVQFNLQFYQSIEKYIRNSSIFSCRVGNDHLVIFLQESQFLKIEENNAYSLVSEELVKNQQTNVNFCYIQSSKDIKIVTCQAGAGVTLACGTGSSASAYVGYKTGRLEKQVNVHTKGGVLIISVEGEGEGEVFLNGPAKWVFSGSISNQ